MYQLDQVPTGFKQTAPPVASTNERVAQTEAGMSSDDAALQARLDNLRRE